MFVFLKSIASCLYSWVWHKVYFPHTFYSQNNSKTHFEPGWAQTFFESKRASQNLDLRHETGTSESSNSIKAKTFLFLKNRKAGKNRTFYGFPQFEKFSKIVLKKFIINNIEESRIRLGWKKVYRLDIMTIATT